MSLIPYMIKYRRLDLTLIEHTYGVRCTTIAPQIRGLEKVKNLAAWKEDGSSDQERQHSIYKAFCGCSTHPVHVISSKRVTRWVVLNISFEPDRLTMVSLGWWICRPINHVFSYVIRGDYSVSSCRFGNIKPPNRIHMPFPNFSIDQLHMTLSQPSMHLSFLQYHGHWFVHFWVVFSEFDEWHVNYSLVIDLHCSLIFLLTHQMWL